MKNYFFGLLFLLVCFVGCSGNSQVSGKVTFPDGAPLKKGEVRFVTSTFTGYGSIQDDGTYKISSSGTNDGVPNGSYNVYIINAVDQPEIDFSKDPGDAPPPVNLIHSKFGSESTSGLSCEVKGKTTFDITVEKPEE